MDEGANILAWRALSKQPVQNLTSDQLALVGSGWAGLMVKGRLDGDEAAYTVSAMRLSKVFDEFCRRCRDLDNHLVPRSEM